MCRDSCLKKCCCCRNFGIRKLLLRNLHLSPLSSWFFRLNLSTMICIDLLFPLSSKPWGTSVHSYLRESALKTQLVCIRQDRIELNETIDDCICNAQTNMAALPCFQFDWTSCEAASASVWRPCFHENDRFPLVSHESFVFLSTLLFASTGPPSITADVNNTPTQWGWNTSAQTVSTKN